MNQCQHTTSKHIRHTDTKVHVCQQCVDQGDTWVHLRLCLECGHVGCCNSSQNKHAQQHFDSVQHPLIRSIEPAEDWVFCYVDDDVVGSIEHHKFKAVEVAF